MDHTQLYLSNQICFPVYTASRLITKAYKPHLDEMGLTYPQYLVLMVLWENDHLSIQTISQKLLLKTNTLSPLLQRMEGMQLLQRKRSKKDERIVHIQLTEKGKNLKQNALQVPEKLLQSLLTENISLSDVVQLKDTLNEWIEILSKHAP